MCRNLSRTRPKPCSPWAIINYRVLLDYGDAITTFERVTKMLPSSSEVRYALALVRRRVGHWDQGISYWEQDLALDPRNMELLTMQHGLTAGFDNSPPRSSSTIECWTLRQTIPI